MPRIELIDELLYQPLDPYHWEIDNLPLKSIYDRQNLMNSALDNVLEEIRDAIGTQGSMANRLNQSIDEDGSLKTDAIDAALHSIAEHTDTDEYVRMTKAQSDKLDSVAEEATNLVIQIDTDDINSVTFDAGILRVKASSAVRPVVVSPNTVKFDLAFPVESAHQHYYGITPVSEDLQNYTVSYYALPFVESSLRVYVNGVRIFSDVEVYVPGPLVDDAWTLLSFTPDSDSGTFALSATISEDDIIKVDFDITYLASGGALVAGQALNSQRATNIGSGGALANGTAKNTEISNNTATGGIVAAGEDIDSIT